MTNLRTRTDALERLLQKERSGGSVQALVDAAIDLCEELVRAGDAPAGLELLEKVRCLRNEVTGESLIKLDVTRVAVLNGVGTPTEALELARDISCKSGEPLRQLPELSDRLQVLQGGSLWLLNRPREAAEHLDRVRGHLLTKPDSPVLALCGIYLSCAYWGLGEYAKASQIALDAVVSARRSGSKYYEAQALTNWAVQLRRACKWGEAAEALDNARQVLERLENRYQTIHTKRGLALLNWKRGRLDTAWELATQCMNEAARERNAMLQAYGHLVLSVVLMHMGDLKGAEEAANSVVGWGPHGESRAAILACEYLGDVRLQRGELQAALTLYEDVYVKAVAVAPKGDIVGDVHCRRAECHFLLGRADEAYEEAKTALEHWRSLGDRYEEAATYRILALSAAAVGKADEAKRYFDEGFAYYEDIQTPYEWGKLWMAYGDWLLGPHAGIYADQRGAHEAYLAAQDHFERIGAKAKLAEANERLKKLVPTETAPAAGLVKDEPRRTPRRPRRALDLERRSAWAFQTFRLVTRSPSMLALLDDVATLARSDTPMLVLGESGTGKELVARGIHALSGRKGTFMAINAGSLPREIIESELFGHVNGAFTGATRDKAGIFEVCNKGTVFLDEIAEMSTELQSRLLRFLETGESRRVGANGNIAVDTRIIAATNRDRRDLERGKDFRVDLYYRLAHAVITLPPLRQRGDDVRLLVEHFLAEACAAAGRQVELSSAAMQSLVGYAWPGNVRQMRAVIKRVVLLAKDGRAVTPEQLELHNADVPTTLNGELEVEERRIVQEALAKVSGSRTEAAKLLGLPRTTLVNKIRRFGL